jgi:hypothetical protein
MSTIITFVQINKILYDNYNSVLCIHYNYETENEMVFVGNNGIIKDVSSVTNFENLTFVKKNKSIYVATFLNNTNIPIYIICNIYFNNV